MVIEKLPACRLPVACLTADRADRADRKEFILKKC